MYTLILILAGTVPSTGEAVKVERAYAVPTLAACHANGKALVAKFAAAGKTAGYYCEVRK